ncbi:Ig-like domain-containing protein, partial [uncultured Methylibium sp.]|uniref:beta strand repeat-containing protein n=1 Tax=uncultured Methylibium sp. TaxID=381093 RepID=UPI0025CCFCB3
SYTVSDGTATATGTLTLTVSPVNDAPVAVADTATTNEDTALTIAPATLLANDTDVDGNPLTIQSVQGAVNGTVALVGGNVVFTPAANYNGPASFTYTVSDGQGGTSTATVNVTVVAVNDAPVNTVPAAQTTAEDSALVFSSANGNALSVADVDGGSLTVTVAVTNGSFTLGSTAGVTVTGNGSGSVQLVGSAAAINAALAGSSYVNTADYNGGATLTLTTSDGSLSDTDTVAITVSPVVDIAADSVTTSEDTPITISVLANDSFENAGRSISAVNGTAITAGGASVSVTNGSVALNASGQLIFTPAANYNGAASFTYTVSSGGVTETATVNVTVTPVNDAPVAVADTRAVAEDATVTATAATGVLANDTDVDAGDTRSVSAFSFGATPGTVGSALVATYGTLTLNADGSYSYVATRPASQALAAGQTATEVFSYTARDAAGATSTTTLTFTITGTNDAPVAVADVGTTPEDTPVSGNVLGNDTDVDAGATLAVTQFTVAGVAGTFTAGSTATIAGVGTLTIAASGAYTFTPAANYNGSVPVASYTVSDGTATATGTLTLTVSPVNDAPVTVADTATAVEAGGVGNAIAGTNPAGNVLTNDTDVDAGDTRSVSAFSFGATSGTVGTGLAGAYGTLTLNADGSYSYVVNNANAAVQALRTAANTLTEVFTYTVRDAAGATSSTTLTVTIQGSNDAPVATADTGSLLENATLATTAATGVLANDTDVDSSDTRSVSAVSFGVTGGTVGTALNGTYGTLTLNADGSYSYSASRPAAEALVAGQVVTEQFSYTVRDTAGATSTATLTFTVTGANDAPTITGTSTGSVTEDTTLSSSGTLTVVDPDAGQSSFVAQTGSTGTYGSFSITTGGAWTYTLNNAAANVQTLAGGTSVSDSFTVTTADGTTRTVVVTVNGTNDAPVATADSLTVNEDNAATGNVLTNDSDVDLGATLAVTQFTVAGVSGTFAAGSTAVIAGVGTLLIAASGAYTFTPVANYNGSVPVATYTVSDGAATATATLSLTVSPVNDAPVNTVPAAQSTLEDTNRVFSTANGNAITVADVDSASVTTTLTVANGTLTLGSTSGVTVSGNGSGTVTVTGSPAAINAALNGTTFQPTANYSGTTSLTVTTNDGSLTDTDSVAITVTPVADVPTLVLSTRSATTSFASSGETAPNTSTTSESILTNPFEGWTRVDGPDAYAGGTNAIEVWTTGDTQQRQDGNSNTIVASAGNGDNFIELNNAATLVQTLGLSRTVSTQVGMVYDLSLDYAGRPGFGTDFTRIGVYLDGVLIQQYSATSPQTYIDWKSLSFAFVGDGADHVLTIRTDASQFNTAGRGAFIDDVRLEGTQGVVAGNAGSGTLTSVALATFVTAPLVDGDGSESLSLIFSGVPAGAVIVTSANPGGYAASGGSITISGAELASAQLQFSSSITGHLSLGVTATATETANGATATNSGSLELDVLPVFTAADIGGDGLNNIIGTTGTDTLNGTGGADYLIGRAGNDTLSAAGGADYLDGGAGNDSLNGGGGNDVLYGGAGNDALTGGTGADVFAWTFGDQGSAGTPATDTIADFNNAAGGDVLDLRDLLVGENAANLSNYLHFTTDGTNTTITVSSAGNGSTDQIIQLSNVNLVAGFSNDTQIINDLLARGKLITDGS